jgi:glycosidase
MPPVKTAPLRDCPPALWAKPSQPDADLRVVGSWNGWKEPGTALPRRSDGWHTTRVELPEGEYGYLVYENGEKRIDIYNPLTTFRGSEEVSLLLVGACQMPEVRVDEVLADLGADAGAMTVRATFLRGRSGAPLAPSTIRAAPEAAGVSEPPPVAFDVEADAATGALTMRFSGLPRGNNVVRLSAEDVEGHRADQAVSLWVEPRAASFSDAVIYEIFVDRFRTSDGRAPSPPRSPGLRAGGTLDGVRAELEKGTFDALGVSALWLSPPTTTPDESRIGRSGRMEEAYHGYWQLDSRQVDPRLGGEEALDRLIETAHRRGIRILIDIVPNHLYEKHPRYLLHRSDGWFHDGPSKCVCGDDGCSWATDIEHCWFTDYLPDYRFENSDVMREAAEDAAYWMTRFHVDGVRIDAVPMMPRAATRRIMDKLRRTVAPAAASFAVGEVFTGGEGLGTIRHYLGPDGLSSAFDFPLMWALRDAVATDRAGFAEVDAVLRQGEAAVAGSGSMLARMLDNHDTSRFLSEAAGDGDRHPWDDPPGDPDTDAPYQRLELGLALLFTLPGIPVLYYGDELALAGASDPDSRRVMPELTLLTARQRRVLEVTQKLAKLRADIAALRTGAARTLLAESHRYVFTRGAASGSLAVVLVSKSASPDTIVLAPGLLPAGRYTDAIDGAELTVDDAGPTPIAMAPFSFRILTLRAHGEVF